MTIQMIRHSIGRRGLVLIAIGIGWVGMGWSVLFDGAVPDADSAILFELIAKHTRAGLWMATGAIAVLAGLRREWQWLGFDREGLHLWSMEVNALIRLATRALEAS